MKTRHSMVAKIASLLLLPTISAGAQTLFYSNAGSGSNAAAGGVTSAGTLASIGFDISSWNRAGSVNGDTGGVSVRADVAGPGVAYDANIVAPGLFSNPPAGTVLDSITFYLYAQAVNPDGAPVGFSLYDGFQGSLGNFIENLPLTGPDDEGGFFSFTVSAAALAGGMAITADGLPVNALLNISSELNLDAFQTPGVSATFVPVPEPAAALLGCLGAFTLLRRRR